MQKPTVYSGKDPIGRTFLLFLSLTILSPLTHAQESQLSAETLEKSKEAISAAFSSLHQGKVEESVAHYIEAVTLDGSNPVGWMGLGEAYFRAADWELSENAFNRLLATAERAMALTQAKLADEADPKKREGYEKSQALYNGYRVAGKHFLGRIYFFQGKFDEAIRRLKEVASIDRDRKEVDRSWQLQWDLARIYAAQAEVLSGAAVPNPTEFEAAIGNAEDHFQDGIRLLDLRDKAGVALPFSQKRSVALFLVEYSDLLGLAVETSENWGHQHIEHTESLLIRNSDRTAQSPILLSRAKLLSPRTPEVYFAMARADFRFHNFERARDTLREAELAVAKLSDPDLYEKMATLSFMKGLMFLGLGDPLHAREELALLQTRRRRLLDFSNNSDLSDEVLAEREKIRNYIDRLVAKLIEKLN